MTNRSKKITEPSSNELCMNKIHEPIAVYQQSKDSKLPII